MQQPLTHSQPQDFLAVPPAGNGPDVSVLRAWWGLDDTIKASCTRLAQCGFIAFAQDLYHGKVAEYPADAEALGSARDSNFLRARAEIAEATMALSQRVKDDSLNLAVIAFSPGALMRWTSPPPTPNRSVPSSSLSWFDV